MSTLALLKSEIADDIERNDLTSAIASEIGKAIRHYQRERFYFNETRDQTFTTTAGQKAYAATDADVIGKIQEMDQLFLESGSERPDDLEQISPVEWELLTGSGSTQGRPRAWCWYGQNIGLYPIPDAEYTIRPMAHVIVDAPSDDAEANNAWMTEAFDLIRARVCKQLSLKKTRDSLMFDTQKAAEDDELNRLRGETAQKIGTGFMRATDF